MSFFGLIDEQVGSTFGLTDGSDAPEPGTVFGLTDGPDQQDPQPLYDQMKQFMPVDVSGAQQQQAPAEALPDLTGKMIRSKVVRGTTGEEIEIEEPATDAMAFVNQQIDIYSALMDCVAS